MKQLNLKLLSEIFITFFKLGAFSFGGGYAMIPLIEREAVVERKWIDKEKIIDVFAVSQSIPGAIAMNASAFVGYSIAGIPGAIVALIGNITPSSIIVLTLSVLFVKFSTYPLVQAALKGIHPAIIALIVYAAYNMGKTAVFDKTTLVILITAFIGAFFLHPIIIILFGGIAGISAISIKAVLATKKNSPSSKKEVE